MSCTIWLAIYGGTRHYLFLVIERDDAQQHLEVLTIGHYARSVSGQS
jgi:hypothetical protein